MSDNQNLGFGKFVPGFDFLQNLAKGASQTLPQMPSLSNWVAPTLNLEDLQKRIDELKAVHFWLDQNSKALGATVQALEVQKMTLATLKGMNFNMGDVANALKLKSAKAADPPAQGMVDPLQWWGALTQQFQQIASSAMTDAARQTALHTAQNMATGVAKETLKTAAGLAKAASGTVTARARKDPAKTPKGKTATRNRGR